MHIDRDVLAAYLHRGALFETFAALCRRDKALAGARRRRPARHRQPIERAVQARQIVRRGRNERLYAKPFPAVVSAVKFVEQHRRLAVHAPGDRNQPLGGHERMHEIGDRPHFVDRIERDHRVRYVAEAYEIPARRVMKREELQAAIHEMLTTDGPFLLEACVIEEGNVLPMTPPGGSVNQMLLEC